MWYICLWVLSAPNLSLQSTRTRTINAPQKFSREQEKPFICNSCNRRYKTQASLKAHQTQYHAVEQVLPEVEKVKEEPPPTSIKKRNPYCDFCLGDDSINRKSGKVEKMVSCADCGRSGTHIHTYDMLVYCNLSC